jgi:vancomycin resistance protein YoaR
MIAKIDTKVTIIHLLIITALVLFLLGISLLSFVVYKQQQLTGRIYPNIYIDNIKVGEQTKEQAIAHFKKENSALKKVNIYVKYKDQTIATFSAEQLQLRSNAPEIVDRAYDIGRTPHDASRIHQKIATIFNLKKFKFTTGIAYDQDPVKNFIKATADSYNIAPKNALFTFEDGRVTTFREHENGLKINSDRFLDDFQKQMNSLENKTENKVIVLTASVVQPDIKLSEANDFGIEELIGEGESDYHHSDENRIHNLTLAATKFNGVIIPKGETFSFNKTIGDVSPQTGFLPGYVILNGKTVLGDGGGVCQVSTTLFRAVMNTGLPIVERHNHAYQVIYYMNDAPLGYDATIYLPDVDFRFKNDTGSAILVQTEIDPENMLLHFRLYGKKDGRRSEVGQPVISNQQPAPPPIQQEDPTLPRGTTKLVEHGVPGATSTFTYKVFDKNNQITFNKTFISYYRPWAQVTLIGTKD